MKPDLDLLFLDGMVFNCPKCGDADTLWWSDAEEAFFCCKCFNNLGGLD